MKIEVVPTYTGLINTILKIFAWLVVPGDLRNSCTDLDETFNGREQML